MIHIPVMFVVEIGSVITTVEFFADPSLFVGLVTLWLWATVLFANFAEAVAEGRGKAQADTLRKSPQGHGRPPAQADGTIEESRPPSSRSATAAWSPRARSSLATATSSRASPSSTSRRSPASPPRWSASPAATDRAVTGGTIVLSDRIVVADHVQPRRDVPGPDDRPGRGRVRQKTPNEIALDILIAGMTLILLVAVVDAAADGGL